MRKSLRYLGSLIFCNVYRLLRIFPNNDPILGCALPFARRDKWWQAALFPIIAMVSFDLLTMRMGVWTIGTSLTYGLIGLVFYKYFKGKKKVGLKTYAKGSIAGVLLFDAITGPVMSSFLFGVPFMVSVIGQIPFTLMHLVSGVCLTLAFAPVLDPMLRADLHQCTTRNLNKFSLLFSKPFLRE